jgi:hypothetical protein
MWINPTLCPVAILARGGAGCHSPAMKRSLILLALLAGCGGADDSANRTAAAGNVASPQAVPAAAEAAGLTGLYEGGQAGQPNQLCIVDGEGGGEAQFGIVVWGSNLHSCSGAGQASRDGARLTLTMAGDATCRIAARFEGGTVTLPGEIPEGCAYYCGARARFTGVSLARKGATRADAMKAVDLAGDRLCEG